MVSCNFAEFWIVFGTVLAVIDIMFLNEWALIPLTKKAKEAQAKHKEENLSEQSEISDTADNNEDNGNG